MTPIRILALVFIFSICGAACLSAAGETLTITTYYPSPYGSYKELRANQIAIGSAYGDVTANPLVDGNLIVSGNVGIGTTNPGAKLDVRGQIRITGGNPGNGRVLTSDDNGMGTWQGGASVRDCVFVTCQGADVSSKCTNTCPAGKSAVTSIYISSYSYWTTLTLCCLS